jgi:hypothetical protein
MKRYGYIVTIFALFTTTVIHAQDITQTTNVSNELQTMFANLSQSSSRVEFSNHYVGVLNEQLKEDVQ